MRTQSTFADLRQHGVRIGYDIYNVQYVKIWHGMWNWKMKIYMKLGRRWRFKCGLFSPNFSYTLDWWYPDVKLTHIMSNIHMLYMWEVNCGPWSETMSAGKLDKWNTWWNGASTVSKMLCNSGRGRSLCALEKYIRRVKISRGLVIRSESVRC